MRGLVLCVLSCLAGEVVGYDDENLGVSPASWPAVPAYTGNANLESPGLGKCLDIALQDVNGRRETIEEVRTQGAINVQLFQCHGEFNQQFRLVEEENDERDERESARRAGKIVSKVLPDRCLEAEDIDVDGSNVHLAPCEDDKPEQKWVYVDGFYVEGVRGGILQVADGKRCLDVKAEETADGGREIWSEIKAHDVNNVQLYECHDLKSQRVNQLWKWIMIGTNDDTQQPLNNNNNLNNNYVTVAGIGSTDGTARAFSLHDLGFKEIAPGLALTMVAISLFAAGVAIGTYRARRVNAFTVPLEPTE